MYLDVYEWGQTTFSVVYTSRNERNALMSRIEKTCAPIGKRVVKISLTDLEREFPAQREVIGGWRRNLAKTPAMLALGLSAL